MKNKAINTEAIRNASDTRNDGALMNAITGLGTGKSKITNTKVGSKSLLSQEEVDDGNHNEW